MVGSYLNATSTFFKGKRPRAPVRDLLERLERRHLGSDLREQLQRLRLLHRRVHAGVRPDVDHARGQYSALGYSGTNSGGTLLIKNSEFDHNEEGVDTNSENTDNPSPQNGACPTARRARSPERWGAGCS